MPRRSNLFRPALAAVAALLTGFGTLAMAQSAPDTDFGTVALLPGWQADNGIETIAVAFDLNPGWKTYWRAPGATGIPPRFDWTGSENIAAVEVVWPTPDVFETFGEQTIGYGGQVILPIRIRPRDTGAPVRVRLALDYGVCEEICIPAFETFTAELPAARGGAAQPAIVAALKSAPRSGQAQGLTGAACGLDRSGDRFELTTDLTFDRALPPDAITVVESPDADLWIGTSRSDVAGGRISGSARMEYYGDGGFLLERDRLRLTVLGSGFAADIRGCTAGG
ncbi:protein-disulfide reductase DsbD domain-containing protein [Oceanomicrobium pacificus]|uniref:Thiol:disulfide interchange protein DsbD N-terminal domain-containing protein n=1 Tax=Oceanomicrobium pacificus TaxID=2692916 RepID=A0A6B0TZX2_9RHOB|nr:protein-disulfide reductase DsbD domain-containing protein [Oceanomicrobium pacificus]MXU66802.1 hypothetical protein [Oceanomicrobium pacificus]